MEEKPLVSAIKTWNDVVREAKQKHWGVYCLLWDTCDSQGMCNMVCPCGGIPTKDGEHVGETV